MADLSSIRNGGTPAHVEPQPDAPIDVGGIGAAIRRNIRLIVAIVIVVGGSVLVISSLSPVRYRADARVAEDPVTAGAVDTASADRRLATYRELAVAPGVLRTAAAKLPGETEQSLAAK